MAVGPERNALPECHERGSDEESNRDEPWHPTHVLTAVRVYPTHASENEPAIFGDLFSKTSQHRHAAMEICVRTVGNAYAPGLLDGDCSIHHRQGVRASSQNDEEKMRSQGVA